MAVKKIAIKKTKSTLLLRDLKLPLYEIPGKVPVSASEIIPVFDPGKTTAKKTFAIKKADLPTFNAGNITGIRSSIRSFLDQYIDSYYPLYGVFPIASPGKFYLNQSVVSYTNTNMWVLSGSNTYNPNESLSFLFVDRPNQWYFLKFDLNFARCRLTITVGDASSQLLLHTVHISEESFGIFVKTQANSFSPLVEVTVDRQYTENESYYFALNGVDLYRTMRVPPGETL